MRKITMKIAAASMAVLMAASMAACSVTTSDAVEETTVESAAEESTVVETSEGTGLANPVKEVSEQEMIEETGIDLPAPEGATNVVYSVIDEGEVKIAQVSFTLDGDDMYLRACPTSETTLNDDSDFDDESADEADTETASEASTEDLCESISNDIDATRNSLRKGDISGLNYDWNLDLGVKMDGLDANVHMTDDGVGYIAWIDTVPGILYNLCMEKGATSDKLFEYAVTAFVPLQGEAE